MYRTICFFLLFSFTIQTYSQKQANFWYFGYGAGLNFNSGVPVAVTDGQVYTTEGCSTVSDANGNLLFYTDGITVYNKLHAVMANGTGLTGNSTSNQSAIIVPKPCSQTIYYVFTNFLNLSYSEVDITLNGGLGAVTATKNILLINEPMEELTAPPHANGVDFWILRSQANNKVNAYRVTSAGVNATPVVSTIGANKNFNYACIKVSPDGKFLARVIWNQGAWIYDFDNSTGIISNERQLEPVGTEYSCEFSPNSKLLYVSDVLTTSPLLRQYDLTATNIAASVYQIPNSSGFQGQLQMGPDFKIYYANYLTTSISVINNPDVLGSGCNYQAAAVSLGGRQSVWGLPALSTAFFSDTVDFTVENVCFNSSTTFILDTSKTYTSALWTFGDGGTSTAISPTHTYSVDGPYTVNVAFTIGCDTNKKYSTKIITIVPNPITASIAGSTGLCQNSAAPDITFTGSNGTPPYTFTYSINGGANQTATTISGNSITVSAPTAVSGTFTYSLISVQDSANVCTKTQTGNATIIVYPLPTAAITGTTTVCNSSTSPDISFTGANGTAPYTFTYTINNGTNQIITTTSGNSVNVAAPTNVPGSFTYSLVSIQDASLSNCSQLQSGSAVVSINPLPTATIAGTTSVCKDAAPPDITYTGAAGIAPYTFTYSINGVTQPTVSSTGNTVTVSVPTFVAGSFTYTLVSIQDASSTTCSQAQSGSVIVTVNPAPTATIAGTTTVCKNQTSPVITFTGAAATPPYTFTYTVNGGTNQTISTTSGNIITVPVPTGTEGVYIYDLVSIEDGSSSPCSQPQTGSATVTINPLPLTNYSFTNVCLNQAMNFYDSSTVSTGSVVGWSWNYNDGTPLDTAQNSSHSFLYPGTFNVSLIVTTSNNCTDSMVKSVVAHPIPSVHFDAPNVCVGSSIQFNDLSAILITDTIQSWTWNFADGSPLSSIQNSSHLFPSAGSYSVQLLVVSNFGCSDSVIKTVILNPNPVVNFSANDTIGCEPLCVSFLNSSSISTGTNASWLWSFGDGSPTSNSQDISHCYSNDSVFLPNYFNVIFTVTSDSGCVTTKSKNNYITVYPTPIASFTVQPQTATITNPIISITDLSSGVNFWNWNFGDTDSSSVFNPAPHTYADSGSYTITLITINQYNCIDTSYQHIFIEPDILFFIPNAFSPDGDGINDSFSGKGVFINTYEMTIFDRWGNLIYKSNDINQAWNGKANHGNEVAQADDYVYVIKVTDFQLRKYKYKGIVTLIR